MSTLQEKPDANSREYPAYTEGVRWARLNGIEGVEPCDNAKTSEYVAILRKISAAAERRYLDDVVLETAFADGAKAWAGLPN